MNKFSHFKWYELVLYSLFSFYCLKTTLDASVIFNNTSGSPFMPIYAKFFNFIPNLFRMVIGIISIQGIIYLVAKKKIGWSLLFFGSLTLILLPFIPFNGIPFDYIFSWYDLTLIFLAIPSVLLLRRSQGAYIISSLNIIFLFVLAIMTLFLRYISFNIFMLLQ